MYMYVYVCICMYMYVYICICMHVCMHVHMYEWIAFKFRKSGRSNRKDRLVYIFCQLNARTTSDV